MKIKIFTVFFVLLAFGKVSLACGFKQDFDRLAFYNVIKEGSIDDINKELLVIDASSIPEKDAYKGTLLMKKAGLVKRPKDKLSFFKEGRIKLETELHNNSSNAEYHFLRLIIQEHAPKITKYRAQLQDDAEYIRKNYKSLSAAVQQVVTDYSKTSKILHATDF